MPGVTQIVFAAKYLDRQKVEGRSVLDVGACDFNGSVRPLIESWNPQNYLGVDIIPGRGVDRVVSADDLVSEFGEGSFDIVLCLEMLEHSPKWKRSISNMKRVCKPGGILLLTTRSIGYPCHGFPFDFWRFGVDDMREIFSDFEINTIESDPGEPGVFVAARKPLQFRERDLEALTTYCMLSSDRQREISPALYRSAYFRRLALKQKIRNAASSGFLWLGRVVSKTLRIR